MPDGSFSWMPWEMVSRKEAYLLSLFGAVLMDRSFVFFLFVIR